MASTDHVNVTFKPNNDVVQITCDDDDETEDEDKSVIKLTTKMKSEEKPINRFGSILDEKLETLSQIFTTGCSCVECMKKMWNRLQLIEDVIPEGKVHGDNDQGDGKVTSLLKTSLIGKGSPSHHDSLDHVASTTELISGMKSRANVPNKDVQKEAAILKKHWSYLVQKMPKNENSLLLCRAIQKKPLILDPFLEMLSECIYFVPPSGKSCEDETTIHMDLKNLLECPGDKPKEFREAQVLFHLVEEIEDLDVKDRILSHPLIATFATLKYQKYQFVSVVLLIYHLLFAILFTNYAFHAFLAEHPILEVAVVTNYSSIILTLMAVLSSCKTLTTYFASGFQFDITTTRRIGEVFCALVAIFMCLLPSFGYPFPFYRKSVNKDITAFGVMASWLVLLSYLTKFNQTAVYVQTFFQIVKNYIQFLWMVALCQLIALSASYSLIFHKFEQGFMLSGNMSRSFIRVLTGRMNYEDFTADKAELENPVSVFNYFVLFFVLSTVMMGMIIGLATNGLQETRSASAVSVLCQVIKDIAELEWIICKLLHIIPRGLHEWLVRKISVKHLLTDNSILVVRPHDPVDKTIPGQLKKSIYTYVIDRGTTCHN